MRIKSTYRLRVLQIILKMHTGVMNNKHKKKLKKNTFLCHHFIPSWYIPEDDLRLRCQVVIN